MLLISILLLALSRAEIVARFNAPTVTQVDGLVRVAPDCSEAVRREFQTPVARFVSGLCRRLYAGHRIPKTRFELPGIIVYLGGETNALTNVVAKATTRADGSRVTRIYLPAPGYSDLTALRLATVKAFHWSLFGESLDDGQARQSILNADPILRANDLRAAIEDWRNGKYRDEYPDDEYYLGLVRGIHTPGAATVSEVLTFASRLYLYPAVYSHPFAGVYRDCTFREAIALAEKDVNVRFVARRKMTSISVFGGGRGEDLNRAAEAYAKFLLELSRYQLSRERLGEMLDEADALLAKALVEARKFEEDYK